MRNWVSGFLICFGAATLAAKSYPVDGIVVAVDPATRSMLVSHRPIPDFMDAMMMPFRVDDARELEGLRPGSRVRFELVVSKDGSRARRVERVPGEDVQIPAPKERLAIGDRVPDFALVDQNGRTVRLSDFQSKVVAVNFIYTRCPLPDVCPRLAANFASLARRFGERADLVLLSITVDPDYDTPAVLAEYASRWKNPWLFLTGDVAKVAPMFGQVYWADEGTIGHNSTSTIIGKNGRIVSVLEGSSFRVEQIEHLVKRALEEAQ
jgi:protein SCO1/2